MLYGHATILSSSRNEKECLMNYNRPLTDKKTRRLAGVGAAVALTGVLTACSSHEGANGQAGAETSTATTATAASETALPVTPTQSAYAKFLGKSVLLPGSNHTEVRQFTIIGDDGKPKPTVFTDFHNLVPAPQIIPQYQPNVTGVSKDGELAASYNVDCYVYDPSQDSNTTRGVFYHATGWAPGNPNASQGDIGGKFTVANTNWNDIPGHETQHRFDPAVPPCPGSPVAQNTGN
jgi:hypothetical protein